MPRKYSGLKYIIQKKPKSSKNKKYIQKSRTARAQQRQLMSVQKQVTSLRRQVKRRSQYTQFFCAPQDGDGPDNAQITLPPGLFYVNNLVRPSSWAPIFQSTAASQESNKTKIMSYDLQLVFSPKNSTTPLTPKIVRVWVLSLKSETAQDTLNGTGNMTTAGLNAAANGLYYKNTFVDGGYATMVKFNPASFKIHAYREFTIANIMQETTVPDDDVAVTNTFNALKRVRIRLRAGNILKPATGIWKNMQPGEIMPKDRKFLCVHVGGWSTDGDNSVQMDTNITVNCKVTN